MAEADLSKAGPQPSRRDTAKLGQNWAIASSSLIYALPGHLLLCSQASRYKAVYTTFSTRVGELAKMEGLLKY